MQIYAASSDSDILKCWPVMHLLRPHLMEGQFLSLIRNMMAGGYRLAFIEEAGIAAAAIGYRYQQKLYDGKQIYVDDLTTLAGHRGKGYGGLPLAPLFELGISEKLNHFFIALSFKAQQIALFLRLLI